ncbi:MAG: folate family ECF transporter S component [Clostridia bacterium]|nr:folate family ECF transporter S component [Clostridia bacterium]
MSKIKVLTCAAMLTAMSVIIGIFCKNFMNFGMGLFRVTFENFPIMLTGVLFGPLIGGIVGGATDLISYLLSSQVYPPNLIVTLGAVMIGVVSGASSRFIVRKRCVKQFIVSGILAHLIGSVIIKSIGLYQFYGILVLWRIPLYIVIASVEILLMCVVYRNSNFRKLLEDFGR